MDAESTEIRRLYVEEKLTLRQIEKIINRDHHYIGRRLVRMGVEIDRTRKGGRADARRKVDIPVTRNCEVCGGEYRPRTKGQRFCSRHCRHAAIAARMVTTTRMVEREIRHCSQCNAEIVCRPMAIQKYCNRRCFELSHKVRMRGENNPSFIDGSSYEKRCYRGEEWDDVRKSVYERDNFTCQNCGVKCVGRRDMDENNSHRLIQCHHRRPYRKNGPNEFENLMTVCVKCHGKLVAELNR